MSCNCKNRPNIGRGVVFCNCESEPQAYAHEECYKKHESNWLAEYPNNLPEDIVEIRFKNTRRSFFHNVNGLDLKLGDIVAVEASPGHDIGTVSLIGDMVARQIKRTGFNPYNGEYKKIYRKAKPYDIEKWQEAIALEHETMIASRQIAAEMGLNMKIGDVEYQGDRIKAIFYYIADERVDFRELIKVFAERFHIRIEMKQIGARQEAGQIGGIGPCGRELCCSAWMSNFTSVTTNAARMQEISLNPQKLIGQCSKLKCCMMYEYDTYADARKEFPRLREPLQALDGEYYLFKNDVLARTMTFSSSKDTITNLITLPVSRVWEIVNINKAGKKVDQLQREEDMPKPSDEPKFCSTEDSITRFDSAKPSRRSSRGRDRGRSQRPAAAKTPQKASEGGEGSEGSEKPRPNNQRRREGGENRNRGNRNRRPRPAAAEGGGNSNGNSNAEKPKQKRQQPKAE
ncbi:MAG: regulatory iron-sulfur-containing complex subunit RicT [Rikenellaceae bacterium]